MSSMDPLRAASCWSECQQARIEKGVIEQALLLFYVLHASVRLQLFDALISLGAYRMHDELDCSSVLGALKIACEGCFLLLDVQDINLKQNAPIRTKAVFENSSEDELIRQGNNLNMYFECRKRIFHHISSAFSKGISPVLFCISPWRLPCKQVYAQGWSTA